jgi:hypothetical protein
MCDGPAQFLHSVGDRHSRNPWQDQSRYVEVWCETDTLSGIFSDALSATALPATSGAGTMGGPLSSAPPTATSGAMKTTT